jgi:hypothetical protein
LTSIKKSTNLVAGFSGLGKTPFLAQFGISITQGTTFLGREAKKGRVLYIDGESGKHQFNKMLGTLCRHAGLSKPPEDFIVWSPYWSREPILDFELAISDRVRAFQPDIVIVDPMRGFFPLAEKESDKTTKMLSFQRGLSGRYGCSWLTVHHPRKPPQAQLGAKPDLATRPHDWFFEVAGSHALVNSVDLRLGIDRANAKSGSDLIVGGFVRGEGAFEPMYVKRDFDEQGEPSGYSLMTGLDRLDQLQREIFSALAATFRYKDVRAALNALGGNSDSTAERYIEVYRNAGLIRAEGQHKARTYYKIQ